MLPVVRILSRILPPLLVWGLLPPASPAARADEPAVEPIPAPAALPARLDLPEALRRLRTGGLDLLIAEAGVRGAEGDLRAARAVQNPGVQLAAGRFFSVDTPPGADPGPLWALSAQLDDRAQIFDALAGKRGLRQKVYDYALSAARLGRADAERTLVAQLKTQYVQAAAAQKTLEFAREAQDSIGQITALNRLRYPKLIDEGALARTEMAKLTADQAVDAAVQTLRQAQLGLAFLLGVRGAVPEFAVDPDVLRLREPGGVSQKDPAQLLQLALDHRPDLKQAQALRARAQAVVAQSRRARIPDIDLFANLNVTGWGQSAPQPPTLIFGLNSALPVFYQQQGEIRRAEADNDAQALQQARLLAQVSSDVQTALAALATAQAQARRMEAVMLGQARKARDITQIQYKAGASTLMDFLDAQRSFVQTNNDYFNVLSSYWAAVFQLEQAIGMELNP